MSISYWSRVCKYCSNRVSRRAMSASFSTPDELGSAGSAVTEGRGVCTSDILAKYSDSMIDAL